ncbi:ATP-binding cassette transporter ABC.B1 [Besnoitia besnoiti]|uniref:ATP-binding cassette transporter ABC.B1 n=1 Tax=Besnoitia besnoiti TaxID=94643 RepID=A0A2A9M859_BESBE|nr:ATP-binding cassette transporter ABC.B1 [Besnoitia besnoiti]PFH33344.1 ATP-binding cassette transporter ABC.B1 [Besnoitia besnoiti]
MGDVPPPSPSQAWKPTDKRLRSFFAPFHFVARGEILVLVVGLIFSLGGGAMMPIFIGLFGDLLTELNTGVDMDYYVKLTAVLGVLKLVIGWVSASAFEYLSDCQETKFKRHYFASLIRQEQGWFDRNDAGSLASRLDANGALIRAGVGVKSATTLEFIATFIGSFILAFTRSWKLTLVVSAALPVIGGCGALLAWSLQNSERHSLDAYSSAGRVAEEALRNIRTVASLGVEDQMTRDYASKLKTAERASIKGGIVTGCGVGGLMSCVFLMYALGFWYAGGLIADDLRAALASATPYTSSGETPQLAFGGGDVVVVLLAVMIGAFNLGEIIPDLGHYLKASEAASDLLRIIRRSSELDPFDATGAKDVALSGDIVYENVSFAYPSRPEKLIFKDLNLTIPGGKTVALVGSSGCGKSTLVQLLQRLYDPTSGTVKLGDCPLKEINLAALRAGLGVVSQEPKLFSASVEENIALGSPTPVTHIEVEAAAKKANAAGFIEDFANKYETDCGSMGAQVSGGQKQRIAIARALVREPSILIFDEATSALDNASEHVVQAALDALVATTGSTTIIIAHRLSTIQRADLIIVLGHKDGQEGSSVVQQGTHEELMKDEQGLYYSLVQSQLIGMHGDEQADTQEQLTGEEPASDTSATSFPAAATSTIHRRVSSQSGISSIKSSASLLSEQLASSKETSLSCPAAPPDVETAKRTGWRPLKKTHAANAKESASKRHLIGLAWKHWPWFLLTLVAAIASGAAFPLSAIIFSNFIAVYFNPDPDEMEREADKWGLAYAILGIAFFFIEWFKFLGIESMGAKVTTDLRQRAFTQTIHQDVAFFDDAKNSVGSLMSILSSDVLVVTTGSCGNPMALATTIAAIAAGCGVAFASSWKLALVLLSCMFVLAPANMMEEKILHSQGDGDKMKPADAKDCPEQVLIEAIGGIRVVSAFGLEQHFIDRYTEGLQRDASRQAKSALSVGFFWGFSQGVQYAINALGMWYGGRLIAEGATATDIMQAIFALLFAGISIGQTVMFSTDNARAQMAAERVFSLIERPSVTDTRDQGGRRFNDHSEKGADVAFTKVNFRYRTRPTVPVYKDLFFTVAAGETVALVGPSGCGKSTAIQLIERFYDLESDAVVERDDKSGKGKPKRKRRNGGSITFDGTELKETNVSSLRQQMGLVGQEPVLFNMSIGDNIRISNPKASEADVVAAAKQAHADTFIRSFPNGYETWVGAGGSQLSGGQKQRIAIARALVRKPRLLLLDEATSALDAEAERQVQQTLDELVDQGHNHGTIIVAHRLSTVKNANKIVVLSNEDGRGSRVVEVGSHDELIKIPNGAYRQLVNMARYSS